MSRDIATDCRFQASDGEKLECIRETFEQVINIAELHEKKETLARCIRCIKEIPKTSEFISAFQLCLNLAKEIESPGERKSILVAIASELPGSSEFISLYSDVMANAMKAAKDIENPKNRKDALLEIAIDLSHKRDLQLQYVEAMTYAIKAANVIEGSQHRIHALLGIANEIPESPELNHLKLNALKSALNLANTVNQPYLEKDSLRSIAKELPKSCDISFYRQYTLLGIAKELPKRGDFLALYKDAMELALIAANVIDEPYYRKYALSYIAEELAGTPAPELFPLYRRTVMDAFKAASAIEDPYTRMHALIDILKMFPKTTEFLPLLQQTLKQILDYFSVKRRLKDIKPIEVLDFILAAEDKGLKESKKARYAKTKYAHILSRELEQFGLQLNDIRLIEILKPYTHVWIQPRELRNTVSKIVNHLEELTKTYHGHEIQRPVQAGLYYPAYKEHNSVNNQAAAVKECISIDLGATNTVIMKKRWDSQPEYIVLNAISKKYGDVSIIPSVLGLEIEAIGAEVDNNNAVVNFKKKLLDGNQEGRKSMEGFFSILYQHLKNEAQRPLWSSIFSNSLTDKLYITVPVGFPDYRKSIEEITGRIMKGVDLELLEEPLAAAIGYQIAEEKDKIVMVIDFGGSTLDIMIVRLNMDEIHVIAKPDRSKMLGGSDIDMWLAEYLSEQVGRSGDRSFTKLTGRAEEIKIALSDSREVSFLWDGYEVCKVSRKDFEEILDKHDFYKTVDRAILYVLHKAGKLGITREKIEAILLTGGSSQIPSFKEKIGDIFPELHEHNTIFNHSPFSAVALGAALYGTRKITDKHLALAYALRYITVNAENPQVHEYAYEVIFEKGESFPFESTFKVMPARLLCEQREIYLELFEVPDNYIIRRWERSNGVEFIKQVVRHTTDMVLRPFKIITLPFDEPLEDEVYITFCINDSGFLKVRYGKDNRELTTDIRLQ